MSIWTIQGETGKGLDATVRDISEVAIAPRLIRRVLDTGTLSWQYVLKDLIPGPGEIIPSYNQAVTLYRNGVAFWRGYVRNVRKVKTAINVDAHDAWWIAEKMPLSSLQTDGVGTTKERASYGFAAQTLTASITALFNRTIAMGVPWQLGTVATTWSFPQMKLTQLYCGAALTELVRLCPDMETWTDYTFSPPKVHFLRRKSGLAAGSATPVTIDARTTSDYDVSSKMEHKVSQVRVPYVVRSGDGRRQFQEQSAGTAVLSEVQMVTVSGAELDTFLPQEELDSVQLKTLSTAASDSEWLSHINTADPVIAGLRQKYGNNWHGGNVVGQWLSTFDVADANGVPYHNVPPSNFDTPLKFFGITRSFTINGQPISGTKYVVTSGTSVPEWLKTSNGITVEEGEMTVDVITELRHKSTVTSDSYPEGLKEFAGHAYNEKTGYDVYGSSYPRIYLLAYKVTLRVTFISASYPTLQTVYKAPDYAFIAPPAGFAQGLLDAQNWVPYEGYVELTDEEAGGSLFSGKLINLSNDLPEYATMNALVSAEDLDIESGTTRIYLGAPARINYRDLADRFRSNSNEQIIYL